MPNIRAKSKALKELIRRAAAAGIPVEETLEMVRAALEKDPEILLYDELEEEAELASKVGDLSDDLPTLD